MLVHLTLPIKTAMLREEGLDFVRKLVEREIKTLIADRHPGYAADGLRCVALYHWPHPDQPDIELITSAYVYSLIRTPLTA